MTNPSRGEVWLADFGFPRGHEQGGERPCLLVSDDRLNHGRSGLVLVIPITSKAKGVPSHVEVNPPEGGLRQQSFIMCEHTRSISSDRLMKRWGMVSLPTMVEVEDRLRILFSL